MKKTQKARVSISLTLVELVDAELLIGIAKLLSNLSFQGTDFCLFLKCFDVLKARDLKHPVCISFWILHGRDSLVFVTLMMLENQTPPSKTS